MAAVTLSSSLPLLGAVIMYNTSGEWFPNFNAIATALALILVTAWTLRLRRADLASQKLKGEPKRPELMTDRVVVPSGLFLLLVVLTPVIVRRGVYELPYPLAW